MSVSQHAREQTWDIEIQLADKSNWEQLAIELMKQGYSVTLFQDKSSLSAQKKFFYFKEGSD